MKRVPLGLREAHIIRRMKNVLKLSVTKIALAVNRHKKSVYKALQPSILPAKRGRPALVSGKQLNVLLRTIRTMVRKRALRARPFGHARH